MSGDRRLYVTREIGIDSRRGIGGQHGNALGKFAARRLRRLQHRDRLVTVIDNHLETLPHFLESSREVPGHLSFRHVDLHHLFRS